MAEHQGFENAQREQPTTPDTLDIAPASFSIPNEIQPAQEITHETLPQTEVRTDRETQPTPLGEPGTPRSWSPIRRKPTKIPLIRDELSARVESVMEEGLEEAYRALTPVEQQKFKIKGEETALQIRELLKSSHVKVKKVFRLLLEWLKFLPGINRFFLEQEAKIKTDKIVSLKHFDHHE